MTAVLESQDVVAGYVPEVDILRGLSFSVGPSELVTLVGPNGAGKSTLIRTVMGLLRPRSGRITLAGEDISGLTPHAIAGRGVGYVPQRANVFPTMTVAENLELSVMGLSRKQRDPRREVMLEMFPLLGGRSRQAAGTLSGGERQMLAIARVLMTQPRLLLLDEPSAGLSPRFVELVFTKIAEINRSGVAVLLVEQNARRALGMSDRGYVLDLGRTCFEGRGTDLLDDDRIADLYLGGRPSTREQTA
jgi:ABC-type branched-subunit amino acid transport system ATPase component